MRVQGRAAPAKYPVLSGRAVGIEPQEVRKEALGKPFPGGRVADVEAPWPREDEEAVAGGPDHEAGVPELSKG